jgi:hypothetical protein
MTTGNGTRHGLRLAIVLMITLLALPATAPVLAVPPEGLPHAYGVARPVNAFDAGVAIAWFGLFQDRVRIERIPPPLAARIYGMAGVTLYETLVPGMTGYQSLVGQLNELDSVTPPGHAKLHWPSAANAALAGAARNLFAGRSPETLAAIDQLEASITQTLRRQAPPPFRSRGQQRGRAVAAAIAAWAATDGSTSACAFTPPSGEGMWVPTPPALAPPLLPCWGQVRTFAVDSGAVCPPGPPPDYSEDPASDFYAEGFEVWETGENLTAEQATIAGFWSDDPGLTSTPPGHWIAITGQILSEDAARLDLAADAYARVGIAVHDAFIACWATKYQYNLLRPITYIQDVIDSDWLPERTTPPFPEYTSGHSVQSGAAATVLTDLFGERAFVDRTKGYLGFAPRAFASFDDAAEEAALSRVYGGIHYRSAVERGMEQGHCVGETILESVHFKQ